MPESENTAPVERFHVTELDKPRLGAIVARLAQGGIVCMPTDTVYGLAVDAGNDDAVRRLFAVKGRPAARPLILLVDSLIMARSLSVPPSGFDQVATRFWPGPVTFILPARAEVSGLLTAGTGTIALRWPDSPVALQIVRELGRPITSTSANRSGQPPVRSAEEALRELDSIDALIENEMPGAARPPSTLIDLTTHPPRLLREGPVTFAEVSRFFDGRIERPLGQRA